MAGGISLRASFTSMQRLLLVFFTLLSEFSLGCGASTVNSTKLASEESTGGSARTKREFFEKYLVFPEGSNVQLIYCLTIATYAQPKGTYVIGITAGMAWELPSKSIFSRLRELKEELKDYRRRSRRELYRKLELMFTTQGFDGEACVLNAICSAANRDSLHDVKGTFLQEIMRAIFTLSEVSGRPNQMSSYEKAYLWGENCQEARTRCPGMF